VLAAYRLLTFVAFVALWPALALLARIRPERWRSRIGGGQRLPRGAIWVHAASVGELLGAQPILETIAASRPPPAVVVSTMTPAGLRVARELALPVAASFLVPFDFPQSVERHLDALAPSALVVVETELWPNLLDAARRRGIPVAIVNARISDRGAARYRALRPLFRRALTATAWIAAQTAADRDRFIALGARPDAVEVLGSTKADARTEEATRGPARSALRLGERDLLVAFGSARTEEDDVFLEVIARLAAADSALRFLYAPRHVERVGALLSRFGGAGIDARALTEWRARGGGGRVLVVDTLGELRAMYPAADVAVIGGSFSRHGGHNPLEAARGGVPVIMGPHRQNVRDAFRRLEASGGAEAVADADGLERALARLLGDPAERAERGRRLRAVCDAEARVTDRVIDGLARAGILPPGSQASRAGGAKC